MQNPLSDFLRNEGYLTIRSAHLKGMTFSSNRQGVSPSGLDASRLTTPTSLS